MTENKQYSCPFCGADTIYSCPLDTSTKVTARTIIMYDCGTKMILEQTGNYTKKEIKRGEKCID